MGFFDKLKRQNEDLASIMSSYGLFVSEDPTENEKFICFNAFDDKWFTVKKIQRKIYFNDEEISCGELNKRLRKMSEADNLLRRVLQSDENPQAIEFLDYLHDFEKSGFLKLNTTIGSSNQSLKIQLINGEKKMEEFTFLLNEAGGIKEIRSTPEGVDKSEVLSPMRAAVLIYEKVKKKKNEINIEKISETTFAKRMKLWEIFYEANDRLRKNKEIEVAFYDTEEYPILIVLYKNGSSVKYEGNADGIRTEIWNIDESRRAEKNEEYAFVNKIMEQEKRLASVSS